ncbi:glycosyltransferase family 24 protein [Trichoderma asperellum CBS 433.97]|uniref:Glycosyltransferase family 24 protein n=1 Tax=Trichoderma asperellum (strain ATCC 204424 / CBS 433.97 / NBRC 101777) TaxID=1042311 RepID=A0A2T3YZJ3_TRIA4|nr:glycosyltransferase family 24 protein [Trichoderma asperellum CBS 433.97]PTB37924.1 glycosyltransferase family 24 protein [Trichoderma asperellum CBS 433.97]
MTRHRWRPWNLIVGSMLALQAHSAPSVNVGMNAAFPAGPYLLELLETAAAENSSSYFPLLDRIATGYFASASTDAALYEKFLQVLQEDGCLSSAEGLSTFKLALSLRSAAPRVEAHYQYYSTVVSPTLGEGPESECFNWVLLDGKQYCKPELEEVIKDGLLSLQNKHLPFDRVLGAGREAILYADITSETFGEYHKALSKAAAEGSLSYRIRYHRTQTTPRATLHMSGYGVELALKKTDYIVIDDRLQDEESHHQNIGAGAGLDDSEDVADIKPLTASDLSSLGLKATSFILQSDDPLETLVKLTQDLPKFLTSIVAHNVSTRFEKEFKLNSLKGVPGGLNLLWLNGVQLIERQIEPFALIERLRQERKLIDGFRALGLNGKQAVSILGHQDVSTAKEGGEALRYDWTDRLEDGRVIIWLNDIESDDVYEDYPKSLTSLLQPSYPGQLPPIGKNIFTLIAPVDFSNPEDVSYIMQLISFISRGISIRFGLVPLISTPEAIVKAKIVYHLFENYGINGLFTYLGQLEDATKLTNEELFARITGDHAPLVDSDKMSLAEVLEADTYEQQLGFAQQWIKRLKVDTPIRPVFLNGLPIIRDENWIQELGMQIGEDLRVVQKGVFLGMLTDDDWAPGIFLNKALSRRNDYITPDDEGKGLTVLNINKIYIEHADLFSNIPVLEFASESLKEDWSAATVIADLTTTSGKGLVLSALEFKRRNSGARIEIVHNPVSSDGAASINAALMANLGSLGDIQDISELSDLMQTPIEDKNKDGYFEALQRFLGASKVPLGAQMIMLNGRMIGPISEDSEFDVDDFQQFLEVEQARRILPILKAVEELGLVDKLSTPLDAAKITSIAALSTISDLPEGIFESATSARTSLYDKWPSTHTIEKGDPEAASVHIVGLINPVSEQGQRWAPILKVLSELEGVHLKLFINPPEKIEELPVKRFFRYVLKSQPTFNDEGEVKGLQATFNGLPSEALLTTAVDVPPAWLVAPLDSIHDLDNIKLSAVKTDVHATYELKHILIEGHSREGKASAPRGAQLILATEKEPLITDTIVMANIGFFQFKANPGVYSIRLKEGRSSEIYEIESIGAQGWNPVPGDNGTELALIDFQGVTLYPRLRRRSGMEAEDILQEKDTQDNNIISKGIKLAESLFGGKSKTKSLSEREHAEINIFSVASGHLYERMLNIMIVSVMRHTNHTVKFWFIEQFLSPSFKEFIPHMAEKYGFKYEMISYKWPHWLRQQKEKQREIWGYKILFLDVLFPLSLDKVIFVDADQVVRTDMINLMNLDLEGAPYGFTPMCDSRVEMEGFRFWKQGYWANYLRGRPYHISALYVVDLRRFRELAAGDRLRQQYHSLSADPNSLANLDQDLPNHMQFNIPIHSLPQEWLWCETWCSDESLVEARTIDLCNNPLTKEPKLDRARRQIPEWVAYDEEIAALHQIYKGEAAVTPGKERLSEGGEETAEVGAEDKNTKSRRLESDGTHTKDEL